MVWKLLNLDRLKLKANYITETRIAFMNRTVASLLGLERLIYIFKILSLKRL
jgi:hypothetical protein